jgi:DNA-binding MarR family transcriptional regulator
MNSQELLAIAREIRILAAITTKLSHTSFEQCLNAQGIGINMMQYGILRHLNSHPGTLSELSKSFLLDPSTLVPVVDSLERKGFVQRGRDPNDRRRVPLSITEEGKKLIERELPMGEGDPFVQALSGMGEERAEKLRELLRDLMSRMPDGDTILSDVATRLHRATPPPQEAVSHLRSAKEKLLASSE